MPTWPESLPDRFDTRGYSEQPPDNLVETSVDAGPAFRRRRTSGHWIPITGAMLMTLAQVKTLKNFVANDLFENALSFDWVEPLPPHETATFRFKKGQAFDISPKSGLLYNVTLNLEMQP